MSSSNHLDLMHARAAFLLLVALGLSASAARAQDDGPAVGAEPASGQRLTAHRTGDFDAVLPYRSLESGPERWATRIGLMADLSPWDYDLADERFSLHVPEGYDPDGEPYGVVVWVSPSDDGEIPEELGATLDERRLIWIGADGAGNERHVYVRTALALDAAHNIVRHYRVDPSRIFVAGMSGGGRVAAMITVAYPDIFAGGLPIAGMTTYLDVPLESNPQRLVTRFPPPSPQALDRARGQPLVIMTGSGDFNREECRLTAAAYERDGYTDLHLLDIDGMGHRMPSAEDFARGLDLLLGG